MNCRLCTVFSVRTPWSGRVLLLSTRPTSTLNDENNKTMASRRLRREIDPIERLVEIKSIAERTEQTIHTNTERQREGNRMTLAKDTQTQTPLRGDNYSFVHHHDTYRAGLLLRSVVEPASILAHTHTHDHLYVPSKRPSIRSHSLALPTFSVSSSSSSLSCVVVVVSIFPLINVDCFGDTSSYDWHHKS